MPTRPKNLRPDSGETLTRYGLEEYVADCVILLDHRVFEQVTTRRLRIVKYRGSLHGTNEYPFLIGKTGFSVQPITSTRLEHKVFKERVSTGIRALDEMFGGEGFYRGSSILVSGSPGTGKSSLAACFADAACRRGERFLMIVYEESADQIVRNMRSIGIDLGQWMEKGVLQIHATRPTLCGLEMHLVSVEGLCANFRPDVVVVDPISNLSLSRSEWELKPALMRLIDLLKTRGITAFFTSLVSGGSSMEESQVGISSLMDSWILLRNIEANGERNRTLRVIKSRGMAHSNQAREFVIGDKGVDLLDIRVVGETVLLGAARTAHEASERASAVLSRQQAERQAKLAARQRKAIEARIAALQAEAEVQEEGAGVLMERETGQNEAAVQAQRATVRRRMGGTSNNSPQEEAK